MRTYRVAVGLTQQQLADRAGVGRNTISNAERGRFSPRRQTRMAIAAALGVPVDQLFGEGA